MALTPTQIGYLRLAPSSHDDPQPRSGSTKKALNKLSNKKLVSYIDGKYRRTSIGDQEVINFDSKIESEIINAFKSILNGNFAINEEHAEYLIQSNLIYKGLDFKLRPTEFAGNLIIRILREKHKSQQQ